VWRLCPSEVEFDSLARLNFDELAGFDEGTTHQPDELLKVAESAPALAERMDNHCRAASEESLGLDQRRRRTVNQLRGHRGVSGLVDLEKPTESFPEPATFSRGGAIVCFGVKGFRAHSINSN